jgi:hypothetical protein
MHYVHAKHDKTSYIVRGGRKELLGLQKWPMICYKRLYGMDFGRLLADDNPMKCDGEMIRLERWPWQ